MKVRGLLRPWRRMVTRPDGGEVLNPVHGAAAQVLPERSTSLEKCKASNAARRDARPDRRLSTGAAVPLSGGWWWCEYVTTDVVDLRGSIVQVYFVLGRVS